MANTYVLMTAMPPTTGHLQLIQFANLLSSDRTIVLLNTQPDEPLAFERVKALKQAIVHAGLAKTTILHIHKTIEQNPTAPGFWDMWKVIMKAADVTSDDYIVASEPYGEQVAQLTGSQFFPYDIERQLNPAKATTVRSDSFARFDDIIPEFRTYLRTRVTIFGAESTGKTTLSRQLARHLRGQWLFEYARPYLEHTINEITVRSMKAIWKGQLALQNQAENITSGPYIIQDTDLFSTVGYWQLPHWRDELGTCPRALINDALAHKSDLYIVTKSNIPFEADPLRYGGDKREGSDQYWTNICEKYELPYIVLETNDPTKRLLESVSAVRAMATQRSARIKYDRCGL